MVLQSMSTRQSKIVQTPCYRALQDRGRHECYINNIVSILQIVKARILTSYFSSPSFELFQLPQIRNTRNYFKYTFKHR